MPQPSSNEELRILRILLVEDNPDDVELTLRELRKSGVEVIADVVTTKSEFVDHLLEHSHDVVIADYQLNGWIGMEALDLMRERARQLPFILLTGVLGEETAVDCIKKGVTDYVLKDRLARLPVAIRRSIIEVQREQERKRTEEKIRANEAMFHTLAEAIDSAIFVYVGSKCVYANHEAAVMTGHSIEELQTMNSLTLVNSESRENVIRLGFRTIGGDEAPRRCEVKITTKLGKVKWIYMTSRAIDLGDKIGRLVSCFDITEQKKADQELLRLANTDPLTGLANYRHLVDAFDSELARCHRTGRSFSLMLLDLDELKRINDSYGHQIGSRALCRVGHILQEQCRSIDIIGRYGGDEFVAILPETGIDAAKHVACRVSQSIEQERENPVLSVSFGLAACPHDGNNFKDVLTIADGNLYSMKGQKTWQARSGSLKS